MSDVKRRIAALGITLAVFGSVTGLLILWLDVRADRIEAGEER